MQASDDQVDSVALATAKKDSILERLNKRNKDRQNYLDFKLEQRSKEGLHLEGIDYFSHTFAERVRDIEARIQNVSDAAAKKSTGDAPIADLARIFGDITLEIQELQRYLTNSTMFLTDYKIKACQNILNDLTNTSEETRLKLLPKKKFGFSGRKAKSSAANAKSADSLDAAKASAEQSNPKQGISNTVFSWTLSQRSNEYICLRGDEVNGKDLTIAELNNCFVELQGHAGSLQITNARNCVFLCGPIARSIFAEFCCDSTVVGACQQLRLHSSNDIQLYIHVTCRAIIEDCQQINVAVYNYDYEGIEQDFIAAGLNKAHNNYTDIADFNWLSPDVHSPNWHLMKDAATPNWHELRHKFQQQSAAAINCNKNL